MNQDWAFEDEHTDDGLIRRYPADKPYAMRDQGLRAADDCVRVVLSDIMDVLEDAGFTEEFEKAKKLYEEANALPWDDHGNWVDVEQDADAPEKLQDILREAEQLDHVYVEWAGEIGMVYITISDYWEEFEDEGADA